MIRFAGRACRLPMAPDVTAFEALLYQGRSAVTQIPEDRWRHAPFYHPVPGTPGRCYSFAAGVVEGIHDFDPAPFGISPREAAYMDPQQRLFLQVVWEALEDACLKPSDLAGKDIGVFAGASLMDYGAGLGYDPQTADGYAMSGASLAVIANRVSHVFDWHGPSMTIDTACSSSLFALKAALRALESGEVEIAVVGATNALLLPSQFVGFAAARMLSPTGACRAFGAGADGYVRGEGAVAFVLVRDSAEARLSPRHRGRLLHVETNISGQTVNIALPSARAQQALLERAYARAGVAPDRLAFVEAHGTGTAAGDPVEARALGQALGQRRAAPLPIGSVKTNIGHLEPAAGSAGLLKALIALERGEVPASLNAPQPNPDIPFEGLNLALLQEGRRLDRGADLAGVSSFGFGGANAHAIVAAPEPDAEPVAETPTPEASAPVHLASAFCREALRETLRDQGARLFDGAGRQNTRLVAEALHHRDLYPHRVALLSREAETARAALEAFEAGQRHPALEAATSRLTDVPPVFVFSGNGAQYVGMSRAAYAGSTAYRAAYDRIDAAWQAEAGWSLVARIEAGDLAEDLPRAPVSQPLLFADQAATALALMARGLQPAAVLGHSAGEVAAAFVAGALDLPSAVRLIAARSQTQQALAGQGGMAALQLGVEAAREVLAAHGDARIEIAAENSPRSVTLVGPRPALDAFTRHARRALRLACVPLRVDYPFHASAQEALREALFDRLGVLHPASGTVPVFSSVTGGRVAGGDLDSFHWWRNMRQPVLFRPAVMALAEAGHRLFLEIGPDPVLTTYLRDTLAEQGDEVAVTHSLARKDPVTPDPLDRVLARALVQGARLDRAALVPAPRGPSRQLRAYPWQFQRLTASDTPALLRDSGRSDYHPLLGRQAGADPSRWSNEMDPELQAPFADHRVAGRCLLPGTALAEMALAAAQRGLGRTEVVLDDFDMTSALALPPRSLVEVRTELSPAERRLRIASRPRWSEEAWRAHASGRYAAAEGSAPAAPAPATPELAAPDPARLPGDGPAHRLYAQAQEIGLTYGPGFRLLSHYRLCPGDEIEVILRDRRPEGYDPADYALDPVGADAVLHGLIGALHEGRFADEALAFVPTRITRLELMRSGGRVASGRIRLLRRGERSLRADLDLFDASGAPLARAEGIELRALRATQPVDLARHAFGLEAVAIAPPGGPARPVPDLAAALAGLGTGLSDRPEAPEEAALLLDALAQRIAFDVLAACPAPQGAEAGAQGQLRQGLADLLAPLGGVPASDDAPCDLPEAATLIAGISEEYPALIAECSALAHLAGALPVWLRDGPPDSEEAGFGRATWTALDRGSAFVRARAEGLAAELVPVLAALTDPAAAPRVVVELCEGAPRLLPHLRAAAGMGAPSLWALSEDTPALLPPALAGGIGQLSLAHLAEIGPVDLVLGCGSALTPVTASTRLAVLRPMLRPGAPVILAEARPRSHLHLLRLLGEALRATRPDLPAAPRLQEAEGLAEAARAAGLEGVAAQSCDGAAGSCLVLARAEAVPEAARDRAEVDTAPPAPTDLADTPEETLRQALLGALAAPPDSDAPEAPLVVLSGDDPAPDDPASTDDGRPPLVLYAPCSPRAEARQDETAALGARLLALSARLAREEGQGARAIWLICPGGAAAPDGPLPDPDQAALWAVLRTAKNEYPAFGIHAVDPSACPPERAAREIAARITAGTRESELILGSEGWQALRVRPGGDGAPAPAPALRLWADPAGGLDRLDWRRADLPEPGPGQVRVEVAATGLNYRDVMWSMGLLPEEALENGFAGPTLGLECAGRVAALGPGVTDLAPGDRVASFGPACLASHMVTEARWLTRLPEGLSAEEAATLPVAFFTAYYALEHLGRMRAGETVLIHGGAGGVGLAAIQIAQWRGARIIATAGTPAKRAYLRARGVEHVFSSRDLGFEAGVRALGGADLVLNALAGEAMERSLALLRPFGRFLELGKVDFYANTGVGLRPLKENIAYHGIDIDRLLRHDPALAQRLFAEVMALLEEGALTPLPLRVFGPDEVEEAFRVMQRSEHLGKVVIRPPATPAPARPADPLLFRPDPEGVVVIAGGGGGLGLALAARMVRPGARKVAVLGRSDTPSTALRLEIARAAEQGAEIRALRCDITDAGALERALEGLRAWGPLDLVVNSAMVLEDMRLADLTDPVLARGLAAKVTGSANLDRLARDDPLRGFVVFTSMATLIGNHGQGAYVAGNAWAEALVRRRRAAGLPGLAVGWGAIHDCGYLTRDAETAQVLRRFGGGVSFGVAQALHALDALLAPGQSVTEDPVIWVSPMSWAAPAASLRLLTGPTHAVLRALGQQAGEAREGEALRDTLEGMSAEGAERRLTGFLLREVARILRVPESGLSAQRPVADLGVDSLMGIELGLAAQQALGDDIPLMAISDSQSLTEIAAKIVAHIQGGAGGDAGLSDLAAQHLGGAGRAEAAPADTRRDPEGGGAMEAAE
ncbi:SDR family NAD(P)-dependent oxidoreductase [Pseudooceanicola sp. 200-1SW]|uniref:SDR family NAD(P)-dependent oxidoreductase n=1 Tax=Pseudooceanicola sp. 200-1SW TaxID=3425949 RepID=UPI003D7F4DF7